MVYGRRKSGPCPVPVIHEVIRVPHDSDDDSADQGSSKRKRSKTSRTAKQPPSNPKIKFLDPKTKGEMEKRTHAYDVDDCSCSLLQDSLLPAELSS